MTDGRTVGGTGGGAAVAVRASAGNGAGTGGGAAVAVPASAGNRRRERERIAMRARLLEAARAIAAEEGWQAVTIRRIADRLEYASPILYQYFSGKDALLLELVSVGFREVTEQLRAASRVDPENLLAALAGAYWGYAFAAPELYQAMNGLDGVPFGTAQTPAEAREAFGVFRGALVRLAEASGRALPDADGAVNTIWACLHGFVSLAMARRIAGGPERAKRLLLRALPAVFDSMLGEPAG